MITSHAVNSLQKPITHPNLLGSAILDDVRTAKQREAQKGLENAVARVLGQVGYVLNEINRLFDEILPIRD